jgi:hypothetical protein
MKRSCNIKSGDRSGFIAGAIFLLVMSVFIPVRMAYPQDAQPSIQIISPDEGKVFAPGDAVTVKVKTEGGVTFFSFAIIEHTPGLPDSNALTSSINQHTLVIPKKIKPGKYLLKAVGVYFFRKASVESAPIFIYIQDR